MKLFKRTNEKNDKHNSETDGVDVYFVYWNTPDGTRWKDPALVDNKRKLKGFISIKDALSFAKKLEDAAELLQSRYRMDITIKKA